MSLLVIALLALSWFVYNEIQIMRAKRQLLLEATRSKFAQLRRDLMAAVHDGDVDPSNKTFSNLYLLLSVLIRHSDSYRALSGAFLTCIAAHKLGARPPLEDIQELRKSEVARRLLGETMRQVVAMCEAHFLAVRVVMMVRRHHSGAFRPKGLHPRFENELRAHDEARRINDELLAA
jgi:hypothetical protein